MAGKDVRKLAAAECTLAAVYAARKGKAATVFLRGPSRDALVKALAVEMLSFMLSVPEAQMDELEEIAGVCVIDAIESVGVGLGKVVTNGSILYQFVTGGKEALVTAVAIEFLRQELSELMTKMLAQRGT